MPQRSPYTDTQLCSVALTIQVIGGEGISQRKSSEENIPVLTETK